MTTSVALAINRRIVIGIINAPCIGKLFAAVKGRGATLNDKPIKVSLCTELSMAQCIMEVWSRDGAKQEEKQLENFRTLISKVHSFRTYGKRKPFLDHSLMIR